MIKHRFGHIGLALMAASILAACGGGGGTVPSAGGPVSNGGAPPAATPTSAPTSAPSGAPTAEPTGAPTATPTAAPIATPTATPTAAPTATPQASDTKLALGMQVGNNVFADGDTPQGGQGQPVDGQSCLYSQPMTFGVFAHLSIFDPHGKQIAVPMGVGEVAPFTISQAAAGPYISRAKCGYTLMTMDRSGIIVTCSGTPFVPTLGMLFDIWGMPLSRNNVAGYAGTVWVETDTPHRAWSATVDPRSIVLTEGLQVTLAVGSPVNPVPQYSDFYGI